MASDSRPSDTSGHPPLRKGLGWRGRLTVAGRVALAAIGGYAVAALATALGAVALPLARAEAVSAAMLVSFSVMAAVIVFVFAVATLRRAAIGVVGTAAVLAACLWLAGGFSAGGPA